MTVRIAQREIAADAAPYVIAEIGVNHDGHLDRALQLIEHAAEAGADAVKFQYFTADALLSDACSLAAYQRSAGAVDPRSMLRELELSLNAVARCVDRAREHGMHVIVTVFSSEHVSDVATLDVHAFKTASPDIINQPLIEVLLSHADTRPLILSTGAAELDEVQRALGWVGDHPHLVMQCVSSYPTHLHDAALRGRLALEQLTPAALGYSDHTPDVCTGALAVASGARLLEKHLTWNRQATGPDHAASLDPVQFAGYVQQCHDAWRALGPIAKTCQPGEQDVRRVSRQSLTTTRPLRAGEQIQPGDVTVKRPGIGLPPCLLHDVIGTVMNRDVDANMPLAADDLCVGDAPRLHEATAT